MVSPSICGGFLTDKNSMVAFTWTITTVLTLFAFITAVILTIQIHSHYRRMERYYQTDDFYQQYYVNDDDNDGEDEEDKEGGSKDYEEDQAAYMLLSSLTARSITFVAVYTMMLATALSLYGSTAIVGFTSLRGVYIAPCFSSGNDQMRIGIFGGAIVIFANLMLVCAVILGEVRVEDYKDEDRDQSEEMQTYRVERIATVLAVTCMFLSALYTIFAILLFLCHASDEVQSEGGVENYDTGTGHTNPLVTVTTAGDQRHMDSPGFITMENSSQGTS